MITVKDNMLFCGDNLNILREFDDEIADLVYLDPPFNSNRDYDTFRDTWSLSDIKDVDREFLMSDHLDLWNLLDVIGNFENSDMQPYLIMMSLRLLELVRILKLTGSIYLHCDPTISHYLKIVMDSILGKKNFKNEIIWEYRTGGSSKTRFAQKHDVILFYTRSQDYKFNQQKEKSYTKSVDRKPGIVNYGQSNTEFLQDEVGVFNYVNMRDVWNISYIHSRAKERIGYPTQKPLALLERIIQASSNEGDVVLDPFAGSGTTLIAAERLGRKWVGIDIWDGFIDLVKHRLSSVAYTGRLC